MKQSNYKQLNGRDLLRMLAMTVIACILTFIQDTLLPTLNIPTEIKLMINYAIAYLIKNYFTKPVEVQSIIGGTKPPVDKDEK